MSNFDISEALRRQSFQLSYANDLLQIFIAFVDSELPIPGKGGQVEAMAYANNSRTYTTAIEVAAEKLVAAIDELHELEKEIDKKQSA